MDPENPHSITRLLARIGFMLLGLLVLYVLSFGPAIWAYNRFPESHGTIEAIYLPLARTIEGSPLEKPMQAYADLWE